MLPHKDQTLFDWIIIGIAVGFLACFLASILSHPVMAFLGFGALVISMAALVFWATRPS